MNKEITIYELLELIKDGKAPKKIKYYDRIFEYEYQLKDYYYESYSLFEDGIEIISDSLNDKVEIIIEDNKIENGLKLYKDYLKDLEGDGCENYHNVTETQYLHRLSIIIKELIDEVNALKENNK